MSIKYKNICKKNYSGNKNLKTSLFNTRKLTPNLNMKPLLPLLNTNMIYLYILYMNKSISNVKIDSITFYIISQRQFKPLMILFDDYHNNMNIEDKIDKNAIPS